ncbi:MAG: bifunctional nuclease family protein [Thermoplasmata archaeon]|nr:MAG: bifunctional nuclease family protein [Thermoplasmata archaeon]HDN96215.1 bifunctional nuclease family protein [Thermoplasmatales archaeon]
MKEKLVKMDVYPHVYHSDRYSEIILVNEDMALPIYVSYTQAESIMNGLHGKRFHRPLTHDLFIQVINLLGGAIKKIVIDDLVDGIFMAKLYIEYYKEGKIEEVVVDARPSDCIALAVREGCDIYVAEKVLKEAGRSKEEMGIENF